MYLRWSTLTKTSRSFPICQAAIVSLSEISLEDSKKALNEELKLFKRAKLYLVPKAGIDNVRSLFKQSFQVPGIEIVSDDENQV